MRVAFKGIALLCVVVAVAVAVATWWTSEGSLPHDERSVVIADDDTMRISIPDTVVSGQPFEVSFASYGGGCVREPAREAIVLTQFTAVVQSFDRSSGRRKCPSDRIRLVHKARLRFDTPGVASVRIFGGRESSAFLRHAATVELARRILVCPCRVAAAIPRAVSRADSTLTVNTTATTKTLVRQGVVYVIDTLLFDGNAIPPEPDALREWGAFQTFRANVTYAAGRGRMDITWTRHPVLTLVDSVATTATRANIGDYYLFDSTGYVLVRPRSRSFVVSSIEDDVYNFEGRRDGWPEYFRFDSPRIDTLREVLSQTTDSAVHIFWHADAKPAIALARGRLTLRDAPMGELNVARFFGATRAIAQLLETTQTLPTSRTTITSAIPKGRLRMTGALPSILLKQELMQLRTAPVDLRTLSLPRTFSDASPRASNAHAGVIQHWRRRPGEG